MAGNVGNDLRVQTLKGRVSHRAGPAGGGRVTAANVKQKAAKRSHLMERITAAKAAGRDASKLIAKRKRLNEKIYAFRHPKS